MSRRCVSEHAGHFPVQRLCELVEVPRSSYYEWSRRPMSAHYLADSDLASEIFDIHDASRRTYGAPRVAGQLHDRGRHHGTKRIARLMAECGLVGVHGRKKWRRGKRPAAPQLTPFNGRGCCGSPLRDFARRAAPGHLVDSVYSWVCLIALLSRFRRGRVMRCGSLPIARASPSIGNWSG